jgi:hypothetical protein
LRDEPFSDIAFTAIIGALNVSLLAYFLSLADKRRIISLNPALRAALVLFFMLGTVHFILASQGRVWFTGQLIVFLFVLIAYITAIQFKGWKAFLFTGLAVAVVAATRNNMIFAAVWPAWYLLKENWPLNWKFPGRDAVRNFSSDQQTRQDIKALLVSSLLGVTPVLIVVILLSIYKTSGLKNRVIFSCADERRGAKRN